MRTDTLVLLPLFISCKILFVANDKPFIPGKDAVSPEFTAFLEAVPDAVVVTNPEGIIVALNARVEGLFGYARAELMGKTVDVLVPDRFTAAHAGHRAAYMASPSTRPMGVGRDLVGRRKDGRDIPVEISLSPFTGPQGTWVLAAVRDVTERRRAREVLEEAAERLERAVAERTADLVEANGALRREMTERRRLEREILGISEREQERIGQALHDNLGQTLTAVTYIAQLMHKRAESGDPADPRDAAEILSLVSGAIDQVRRLARGLYPVELKANGLVPALQELAAAAQAQWKVPCEVGFASPDPVTDPATAIQIYRIAQEAVANAAKHAKPGKILLRLESMRDGVELSVEDDGCGLPDTVAPASGMGLHIMKYRADMIGADFALHRRKDGGTAVVCRWTRDG
jgi:two-component system CheB/CheR fusion protein